MATAAMSRKGSANNHAAKNGKSAAAAKRNNGALDDTPADCGEVAKSLARSGLAKSPLAKSKNGSTHKSPSWFTAFAQKTSYFAGRPITFLLAVLTIVIWGATGPLFGYSDTWQLVINTGTTIVTFLMVFLIQNSQNRDALAFQVKLDELIIKLHGAGNEIAGAEDLCDEDLEALHEAYKRRAAHAHDTLEKRRAARDTSHR
jgi:low affinity Fe/Cu permease